MAQLAKMNASTEKILRGFFIRVRVLRRFYTSYANACRVIYNILDVRVAETRFIKDPIMNPGSQERLFNGLQV